MDIVFDVGQIFIEEKIKEFFKPGRMGFYLGV
jgi:hypothetical protein